MSSVAKAAPVIKELVYIPIKYIQYTNTNLDKKLVKRIAKHLDWDLFKAVPVYNDGKQFILTDGNHRTKGAEKRGEKLIPAILLTKEEFDYVAFSKRTLDFLVAK